MFEFVCVTSRQHAITQQTYDWIESHYPDIFSKIVFGNHWTPDAPHPELAKSTKRSKPDMCVDVNAVALIDDSLRYARQCSEELGKHGFKVSFL